MDVVTNKLLREATPLFSALASVLLLISTGAILYFASEILIPLALAILLSLALSPIASRLRRIGASRGLAVAGSLILAIVVIGTIGYVVISQFAEMAGELPKYQQTLHDRILSLDQSLRGGGPFSRAGNSIADLMGDVRKLVNASPPPAQPTQVEVVGGGESPMLMARSYVMPLVSPLATAAVVALLTTFMLAQREELRNKLIRLMGTEDLQATTAALDDAGARLGRMMLAQVGMNATFAVLVGVTLALIGLPTPYLWGILAGIFRFVPYIGAVISAAPPVLLAFALLPGWAGVIEVGLLFFGLESFFGQVLEPLIYGRSTGLSPLAVIAAAAIWAFLWGPVGLVLATPLTIVLVVLGRHVTRLEFLEVLLSDEPALTRPEMFYQRMLAGNPSEERIQARDYMRRGALGRYFDDIALPALRRAHLDVEHSSIVGERLDRMIFALRSLIAEVGHDGAHRGLMRVRRMGPRKPKAALAVAVAFNDDPFDGPAALMLGLALGQRGFVSRVVSMREGEQAPESERREIAILMLSFFEPVSTLHLRAAVRSARRSTPGARVVVCIWRKTDDEWLRELRSRLRVDAVTTSIVESLEVAERITGVDLRPVPHQEPTAAAGVVLR